MSPAALPTTLAAGCTPISSHDATHSGEQAEVEGGRWEDLEQENTPAHTAQFQNHNRPHKPGMQR
jgi:hypothetical protein